MKRHGRDEDQLPHKEDGIGRFCTRTNSAMKGVHGSQMQEQGGRFMKLAQCAIRLRDSLPQAITKAKNLGRVTEGPNICTCNRHIQNVKFGYGVWER